MKHLMALKNAFFYSMNGMRFLLKERAFQYELIVGCALLLIEFFKCSSAFMRLYLLMAYVVMLITEALNTAVEAAIDRIGTERHPLSKAAKDIGSGAAFISQIHLGIVWLLSWMIR